MQNSEKILSDREERFSRQKDVIVVIIRQFQILNNFIKDVVFDAADEIVLVVQVLFEELSLQYLAMAFDRVIRGISESIS